MLSSCRAVMMVWTTGDQYQARGNNREKGVGYDRASRWVTARPRLRSNRKRGTIITQHVAEWLRLVGKANLNSPGQIIPALYRVPTEWRKRVTLMQADGVQIVDVIQSINESLRN